LYEWTGNVPQTVAGTILAETTVPRRLFSGGAGHGGDEMIATYGGAEVDIAVPLSAPTKPGGVYMVEFAVDGPCNASQGYVSYGWVDGYPGGQLFKNQAAQNWDMCLRVYHADR
jgi:hypothetical protein